MDGLETINEEAFKVAVPACKLEKADQMSLILYESFMQSRETSKKTKLTNSLEEYESLVAKYDEAEERKAIEKDLDSMNMYFSKI